MAPPSQVGAIVVSRGGHQVRGMPWRRRVPDVVVVTRVGCSLCEEMVRVVTDASRGIPVSTLDVDAALADGRIDRAQHDRWTTMVPVLLVDGRERAVHRVAPADVRRSLRGR